MENLSSPRLVVCWSPDEVYWVLDNGHQMAMLINVRGFIGNYLVISKSFPFFNYALSTIYNIRWIFVFELLINTVACARTCYFFIVLKPSKTYNLSARK
jgi:hypothetical protein